MNNVFMNHKRKKSQKRLSDKIKKCEEITIYLEIVKFQKSQITISQKIKEDMSGEITSKQKKKQKK